MIVYQELSRYGPSIFKKIVTERPQWIKERENYNLFKLMEENPNNFFNKSEEGIINAINSSRIHFYDRDFYEEICVKLFVYVSSGKKDEFALIDIIAFPYLNFLLILGEKAWNEAYSLRHFDVEELYKMWKNINIPQFFKQHLKEGQL